MSDTEAAAQMFANYQPRDVESSAIPINRLIVRSSVPSDVPAIAQITAERNGDDASRYFESLRSEIDELPKRSDRILLSGVIDSRVVGFARARIFVPPDNAPANVAPTGWYLLGVTVNATFRRRGIGRELTRSRLIEISKRSREAFYFANAMNRASIDLHASFGFIEVTRDFWYPNTSFVGGRGILFRAQLN